MSGNIEDVKEAIKYGFPAGYVSETGYEDDVTDDELRIAFDFDAVLADDSSERVFQEKGLGKYLEHESQHGSTPMEKGPLYQFLSRISKIQRAEIKKREEDPLYHQKVRIAVCTARNAPAHKRVVTTLRSGIYVLMSLSFWAG